MNEKSTSDLRQELQKTADLDYFLDRNEEAFQLESIPQILNEYMLRRDITKSVLAKNSGMSEVFLHQIFSGRRRPSRSRLISLCFGLELSLDESQIFLRRCGFAELYTRNRRDAILIYGLMHRMTIFQINDKLYEKGEETLF